MRASDGGRVVKNCNPSCNLAQMSQPAEQRRTVRMSRETVELFDSSGNAARAAVNADFLLAIQDPSAQRVMALVTDEQDCRFGAADVVLEMVLDAARRAHPRRSHDDARPLDFVDCLGILHRADQSQTREPQRRFWAAFAG